MKKYFLPIILCVITGIIMARLMFNQYDTKLASANVLNKAYFFQVGVFSKIENMNKEASKYDSYIYIKKDNKYYVYIGITKDNYEKLQNYFDSLGYKTYVKEMEIDSSFESRLKEYDDKLKDSNNEDTKKIIDDILKTYGELNDKN